MDPVSFDQLTAGVKQLLQDRDLASVSLRGLRTELEQHLGLDAGVLDERKEELKGIAVQEIAARQREVALASAPAPATQADEKKAKREGRKRRADDDVADLAETPEPKQARAAEPAEGEGERKNGMSKARQRNAFTKKAFMEAAKAFKINVGDKAMQVPTKKFSTGSCGWWQTGKANVKVGDQEVTVQAQLSFIVIGSKEWTES